MTSYDRTQRATQEIEDFIEQERDFERDQRVRGKETELLSTKQYVQIMVVEEVLRTKLEHDQVVEEDYAGRIAFQ